MKEELYAARRELARLQRKLDETLKKTAKLKVLHIPKRSPELNVLDFAVWSEVERRMRDLFISEKEATAKHHKNNKIK